ncbi:MAG TPA: class I SAM-dependent methyltransferase [Ramlibacter sp.]|uniref:class I SAM-dependent methyltransferase n=1 Tax=Ramlibacter sp. TaxID=1917967 RepID=UPI002C469C4A|nr:class I SAM-dependent methyltransferase [Ramlibacter sp.]HVZ44024.1 class I SAM-dependent methyltransferase [Ramlibacter sp.]
MAREVHSAAQQGYTREAATYSRGRPGYPSELQEWLRGTLGLGPGKRVADVGAGTGKFSKLVLATGAEVVAVEPVASMRREAAGVAGLQVVEGTAQHLPFADASLDAIVCAQAFHWFASAEVLDEFARVLEAGGKLGLIWNVRDESVDWVRRLTDIMSPHEGDAPRYWKGEWRDAFPHAGFSALEKTAFAYEHTGSPQQVVIDRVMSVSFIASLDEAGQAGVRQQLEELLATHPELRGRETLRFPYRTDAFACERVGRVA